MIVAAVDIGTNSVRLLVRDAGTGTDLERRTAITRVGEGTQASGRLRPEAIARTVDVLRDFRGAIDAHGTGAVRVVATSAARDAANRNELFDAVEPVLGARPELLSGADEGRLSFAGAVAGLDAADGPSLVIDIGGGSTEFILGRDDVSGVTSVDIGSVRITEAYLRHDPPQPEELANAIGVAHDHLDDVRRELPGVVEFGRLVGVGGTITTVAAVELGLATYHRDRVHHLTLPRAAVEDVFRTLAMERLADRVHNPGLPAERADIIVGGCCILVAIMRGLAADEVLVSDSDLLDGVAAGLGESPR